VSDNIEAIEFELADLKKKLVDQTAQITWLNIELGQL
jgi:hypothetical protein